jgi:RNA ligase (TIGR02306 family)
MEIAQVGDFQVCVRKGAYKTGDIAAYIPEAAVLPDSLIEELGLTGRLAGSKKNRVKAVKLRGVTSLGLLAPARPHWVVGMDVQEELGITKYVPEIPLAMEGQVWNAGIENCVRYDIENFRKYPDVFEDGEPVVITEKLHGTFACIGVSKDGDIIVHSKGLGHNGLAFKLNEENLGRNVYVVTLYETLKLHERLAPGEYVLGEVFGSGVQDLHYGQKKPSFRVFDVVRNRTFLSDQELTAFCEERGMERVPVLYRGPFSRDVLVEHASGITTFDGVEHIREGAVVRPVTERRAVMDGIEQRAQLKYLNDSYLLRKGGTEYT